jgi:hypothetical protein
VRLNAAQRSDPSRFRGYTNEVPDTKLQLARATDALAEIYQLLEDYAPVWYTEHHHHKTLSALRALKKLQGINI